MKSNVIGRPPGQRTKYWTAEEKAHVKKALDDITKKLPDRTRNAIIQMMLRIESGELDA